MKKILLILCVSSVVFAQQPVPTIKTAPPATKTPSVPATTLKTQTPTISTPQGAPIAPAIKKTRGEILKKQAEQAAKRGEYFKHRAEYYSRTGKIDIAAHYKKLSELSQNMAKEFEALSLIEK